MVSIYINGAVFAMLREVEGDFGSVKKQNFPVRCILFWRNMTMEEPCTNCQNECDVRHPGSEGKCYVSLGIRHCQCEWNCEKKKN